MDNYIINRWDSSVVTWMIEIHNLASVMLPTQILVELYTCGNTENLLFLPFELI